MPAIFDHFVTGYGFTAHKAWRVSFTIPFAIITGTAILLLLLCPDTPTGKWSERKQHVIENLDHEHKAGHVVEHSGLVHDLPTQDTKAPSFKDEKLSAHSSNEVVNVEAGQVVDAVADEYTHEVVQDPTAMEILKVMGSPQTLALCAAYFCSFGAELAINSILGAYYLKNFPKLGQTSSGRWAAMFGLLNVYGRPLGGMISDIIYKVTNGNLWAKKLWIHGLGIGTGIMCLAIGFTNPHNLHNMIGLVAGLAFFMDAGNGANFALVPHVHPHANGKLLPYSLNLSSHLPILTSFTPSLNHTS